MNTIKEYRVITNSNENEFKVKLEESINEFQKMGYKLDIKYSISIMNSNTLVSSVMILCY